MKTFRAFSLLAAACACLAAVSTWAVQAVVSVYRAARNWVSAQFGVAVKSFAKPEHMPAPAVKFVAAMAYVMRQAKRVRPTVTPRWRMCPSA